LTDSRPSSTKTTSQSAKELASAPNVLASPSGVPPSFHHWTDTGVWNDCLFAVFDAMFSLVVRYRNGLGSMRWARNGSSRRKTTVLVKFLPSMITSRIKRDFWIWRFIDRFGRCILVAISWCHNDFPSHHHLLLSFFMFLSAEYPRISRKLQWQKHENPISCMRHTPRIMERVDVHAVWLVVMEVWDLSESMELIWSVKYSVNERSIWDG